jgi:hypothetical protein
MTKLLLSGYGGLLLWLAAVPAFGQPDLIVDQKFLNQNWIVRTEDFTSTQCDAVEGGHLSGRASDHALQRFYPEHRQRA